MFDIYGAIKQIRLEERWQASKNHTNFINKKCSRNRVKKRKIRKK